MTAVSPLNDFVTQLAALGYTGFTSTGASLILDPNSAIDFYFHGSESGYNDTFTAGAVSVTEMSASTPWIPAGTYLGSEAFAAGSLAGLLNFTSNAGAPATVGQNGFGIFLQEGFVSGSKVTEFIIGYDDQITNPDDDNHDDLIIRGVVRAVPEPGTWATLLLGFGVLGAAMRRKAAKTVRVRAAIA
ncbi:MAG TPA: PEPxxWA-CTERM sorting domain-containing protein [Croceibacterium sp.]|nr:PEPxxWA-CTERM sorting domain-containing protein [Croceibacterium sp.]